MILTWDYGAASNTHRGIRLSVDDAIIFLSNFHFGRPKDIMFKSATIRYLRFLSEMEGGEKIRDVLFVQMAHHMEGHNLRTRTLDSGSKLLSSTLLQGAGGSYGGDATIVAPDTVTIQLHHIEFTNKVQPGFPTSAYTLALNFPDELAARYAQNCDFKETDDADNY